MKYLSSSIILTLNTNKNTNKRKLNKTLLIKYLKDLPIH